MSDNNETRISRRDAGFVVYQKFIHSAFPTRISASMVISVN